MSLFDGVSLHKAPGGFTPRTPQSIWGKMKGCGILLNKCLLADGVWA
jgi:hypothetical protein